MIATLLALGCDDVGSIDASIPIDATPMVTCPSEISFSRVEVVASPNGDPSELLWSVKGYGMKTGPNDHNGITIAEQLVALEDENMLSDDFVPVGVETCPFNAGDVQRVFSCGSAESLFIVGGPGEIRYADNRVIQFDSESNVFWDPYSIIADGSPLATVNEILSDDGMPIIERCRLGCIQTYHCDKKSNPAIALFFRVEDYVWDQPIIAATDVETRIVDENGNVF